MKSETHSSNDVSDVLCLHYWGRTNTSITLDRKDCWSIVGYDSDMTYIKRFIICNFVKAALLLLIDQGLIFIWLNQFLHIIWIMSFHPSLLGFPGCLFAEQLHGLLIWSFPSGFGQGLGAWFLEHYLLMPEIPNNHLGCIKPYKQWHNLPTSTGAGF